MRKVGVITLLACIITIKSNSQTVLVGVKGGITIPELRSPDDPGQLNSGYKSIAGPHVGFVLERKLNKLFSLQAEFNYSVGGAVRSGNQRIKGSMFNEYNQVAYPGQPTPQYLYANFQNTVKLKYFDVPLLAKFSFPIGLNSRISLMGGGFVSYLTYAHVLATGKGKIYRDAEHTDPYINQEFELNADENILDQCNRFNYGISGGLSVSKSFLGWELSLTGSGMYGFADLQKDERYGKNKTGAAVIALGLAKKL
jgi:hypothetical protein